MKLKGTPMRLRDVLTIALPALLLIIGAFWATLKFVQPAAPNRFVIATASKGSPYYVLAERYQRFMARNGVSLEIKETNGSLENLRLLTADSSGVSAGFLQGGLVSRNDVQHLRSIGRVMYEPLWIFYRAGLQIQTLADLAGKRVLVGPAGGGTNLVANRLLNANGITPETATLVNMELPDYVDALNHGEADAGFLVLGASAVTVQRLFNSPDISLFNVMQADAYAERFPFLARVDLKRGVRFWQECSTSRHRSCRDDDCYRSA
jgi:TRAP transporter TAXI family solute receptor